MNTHNDNDDGEVFLDDNDIIEEFTVDAEGNALFYISLYVLEVQYLILRACLLLQIFLMQMKMPVLMKKSLVHDI